MATVVVLPITTLTQFNAVNNSTSGVGAKTTLFTASSAANVRTMMTGIFSASSTGSIVLCIGPTAGNAPSVNGVTSFGADGINVTYAASQQGSAGAAPIYQISPDYALWSVTGATVILRLKDYVIPPGYSVYAYQEAAPAGSWGYNIEQMQVDYNV